jgi:PII-like signaling protein
MPKITGAARRLRSYVGEADRWRGQPRYDVIVRKAKELGIGLARLL